MQSYYFFRQFGSKRLNPEAQQGPHIIIDHLDRVVVGP